MRHQDGTELFPAEEMQSPFDVIKETIVKPSMNVDESHYSNTK